MSYIMILFDRSVISNNHFEEEININNGEIRVVTVIMNPCSHITF